MTKRLLESIPNVRCALRQSGGEVIEALKTLQAHVVMCRQTRTPGDLSPARLEGFIRTGHACRHDLPLIVLCPPDELAFHRVVETGATRYVDGSDDHLIEELIGQLARKSAFRPSLLVIEDDVDAAGLYVSVLQKDFAPEVMHDGREGLEAWRRRHHELVLLDLGLPGLDGRSVLRAMMQEDPEQVVIICTLQDTLEDHAELVTLGAADFVMKTTALPHLPALCKKVLSRMRNEKASALAHTDRATLHELADRVNTALRYHNAGAHCMAGVHLKRAALEATSVPLDEDRAACG
jgi:DNA-binding response OmpR family regulator